MGEHPAGDGRPSNARAAMRREARPGGCGVYRVQIGFVIGRSGFVGRSLHLHIPFFLATSSSPSAGFVGRPYICTWFPQNGPYYGHGRAEHTVYSECGNAAVRVRLFDRGRPVLDLCSGRAAYEFVPPETR